MNQLIKVSLFLFLLIVGLSTLPLTPQELTDKAEDEKSTTVDVDVVFVVNVSRGMQGHLTLVREFVDAVYMNFKKTDRDNFYIITFSDRAELHGRRSEGADVFNQIQAAARRRTRVVDPKVGLAGVFDLVESGFPPKKRIILFVSNGEDSRKPAKSKDNPRGVREELNRTIRALKKTGFTVFSIFTSSNQKGKKDKEDDQQYHMTMISEWAGTPPLPITRAADIVKAIRSLEEEVNRRGVSNPVPRSEYDNYVENSDKRINQLKSEIDEENKKFQELRKSNEMLAQQNNTNVVKLKRRSFIILGLIIIQVSALFVLILLIVVFIKKSGTHVSEKTAMWGKLISKKGSTDSKNDRIIDLSNTHAADSIQNLEKTLHFRFVPCSYFGRKAICVQVKDGYVSYSKIGEKKLSKTTQYIGDDAKQIKISTLYGKHFCQYEYHFLDKLKESSEEPVWEKNEFIGREKALDTIKGFFSEEEVYCTNLIISGMGNSGKTSLLVHLNEIFFKKDRQLKQLCISDLLIFDPSRHTAFKAFENECQEKVKKLLKKKTARKILMIDDYDNLLDRFEYDFEKLICNLHKKDGIYLVLAGRRPGTLVDRRYIEFPSLHFERIVLKGIANPTELIDSILQEIGFHGDWLSDEVKEKIAYYASDIPYFCKAILYELLSNWLQDFDKESLSVRDVENAALQAAEDKRDYYLRKTVPRYDVKDQGINDRVCFFDIISYILSAGGKVKKSEVQRETTRHFEPEVERSRKRCFEEKLKQLKELGLVIEERDYLMGIPRLLYHNREVVKENESTN